MLAKENAQLKKVNEELNGLVRELKNKDT